MYGGRRDGDRCAKCPSFSEICYRMQVEGERRASGTAHGGLDTLRRM